MIRTIIIEDELRGRNALKKMLEEFDDKIELIGLAEDAESGELLIKNLKPDLVFLDIEMPHRNGFDMLASIKEKDFEVIFTTAYDQYAIKAFKFSAVDYLLKPIDADDLESAIEKVIIKLRSKGKDNSQLDILLQNIRNIQTTKSKLALPTLDGLIFVNTEDIIRCESDDNYTKFYLINSKPILVSKTLKDFEELLNAHNFIRVHHSHLINLAHIKRYIKGEGGVIIMADDSSVEVSRRKKEVFIEKLKSISGK